MTPAGTPAALTCRGLRVELGGRTILHDVDLAVRPGEWLGLVGPNGAGKTTLLRAVVGLVGHQGDIRTADGRRPTATDVALVAQQPVIPDGMTVTEYVLVARTAHLGWLAREGRRDRAIVAAALRRLDLATFADRRVATLSGGETQRVLVARALAQQTPILLLDEPTSALDLGRQHAVLELVDELRRNDGLAVVAAMHDLTSAARFADHLLLLDAGRVVTTGSAEEVLDAVRLSAVFQTPLTVHRIDGALVVLPGPRTQRAEPEHRR